MNTLRAVLTRLCEVVDELGSSFPNPTLTRFGDGYVDRHSGAERTNGLVCYLKAVKVCSTLNGAMVLLERMHVQEAYALCRIAQEQIQDIEFLAQARGSSGDDLSPHQYAALEEFFQEEFLDPDDPIGTAQERHRVPRKKIIAALARDLTLADPSGTQAILQTLQGVFSGYVHGAYGQIMELHGETPGHYNFYGTPLHLTQAIDYMPNFVFQATAAVDELVKRNGRADLLPRIESLRQDIVATFDILPAKRRPNTPSS